MKNWVHNWWISSKEKVKLFFNWEHFKFVLERELNRTNAIKFVIYVLAFLVWNLILILQRNFLWYDSVSTFAFIALALFFLVRVHIFVLGQSVSVALYNAKVNISEQLSFVRREERSKSISQGEFAKIHAKRSYAFLYFLSFITLIILIITIPFLVINA